MKIKKNVQVEPSRWLFLMKGLMIPLSGNDQQPGLEDDPGGNKYRRQHRCIGGMPAECLDDKGGPCHRRENDQGPVEKQIEGHHTDDTPDQGHQRAGMVPHHQRQVEGNGAAGHESPDTDGQFLEKQRQDRTDDPAHQPCRPEHPEGLRPKNSWAA